VILTIIVGIAIYYSLSKSLLRERKVILSHGVQSVEYIILFALFFSFLLPFFSLYIPVYPLGYLFLPYPIGVFLFIPGIVFSKKMAYKLETSGVDYIIKSGRVVSNIMWLGVAGVVLYIINWLISVVSSSVSIW
jgi:hypothetical protein